MYSERRFTRGQDDDVDEGDERGRGRGFARKPRVCQFCVDKVDVIHYKQPDMLRKFINEQAKIRPRRQTGTCARHQRALAGALKQARHMALLPYTGHSTR